MLSNISINIALFLATALFDLTSAGLLHPHSGRWSSLARRADSDETDHSDIKKWAALGDSFAAGIGAGTRLTDWGSWYCSRYDDSYPSVINRSPSLGSSDGRDFKYYACSGAITTDVKNSQIPGLSGLQMATLSVGGNDANLKEILHACIYQWNKDPTLDCDKTLDESQKTIDSPQFSKNLDDVLNALKGAMASSDAKIYWTGYSHFWDASTNACDSVTWAFKYNIIHRQYLTQARRTVMNNLVDAVNQKIQDAIQRFGEQAIFVPWGPDVDCIGGHYCEPDVDESNAIDREQTAFYEWGTTKDDDLGDDKHDELRKRQEPGKLQAGQDLKNTWEGAISGWVTEAIQDGAKPEDFGLNQDDVVQAQSGLLLPDKYGRVFHPTRFAHMMIAENVLRTMDLTKAKSKGKKAATTTIVGCPSPTGPASHVGEGSSCNVDSPSDEVKFKIDDAYKVINDYCIKHQGDTVRSGPDGILEKYQNGDDQGSSLILMASLDTEPVCENYPNLGRLNFFDCFGRFSNAMNDCKYIPLPSFFFSFSSLLKGQLHFPIFHASFPFINFRLPFLPLAPYEPLCTAGNDKVHMASPLEKCE